MKQIIGAQSQERPAFPVRNRLIQPPHEVRWAVISAGAGGAQGQVVCRRTRRFFLGPIGQRRQL
jgi:hypothetical protein